MENNFTPENHPFRNHIIVQLHELFEEIYSKMKRDVGLILLLLIFVKSSLSKIYNPSNAYMSLMSMNLPIPIAVLGVIFAITSQLFGVSTILYGRYTGNNRLANSGIISLITFTLLATLMFHNPIVDSDQLNNFLKNLGLIGGLLLVSF